MARTAGAKSNWRRAFKPLEWMDDALCRQVDAELFFPEKNGSMRKAKAVCHACPVIAECGAWALADSSLSGVLGGMSDRERIRIRRQRRREAS